jgi:selenide,water dikinase
MIVPFPPGGSTDIFGRLMADALTRQLGVQVVVDTDSIVAYPGAREAAERGVRTGGDPRNREYVTGNIDSSASAAGEALCMDPQTSGGLLAAVDPALADRLLHGDTGTSWWRVGEVAAGPARLVLR